MGCAKPNGPMSTERPLPNDATWADPQIFLKMAAGKAEHETFYDIVDFINLYGTVQQEEVVGSGQNGAQLIWKTGPRKPKLSSVTLPQWSVANLAIMSRLTEDGKLIGEAVTDYLSYTTRIYLMLQRYDITSVFLYDREYRRLQARNGFR